MFSCGVTNDSNADLYSRDIQFNLLIFRAIIGHRVGTMHRTHSHVLGLSPGWAPPRSDLGLATYTCVPLSPSSIIWYPPRGSDALWPRR